MKWPSKMIFIVVLPLYSPRMNIQQKQNLLCKNYIPFRISQKHGKFLCVWLGVISSSINILISEEWYSNLLVWSFFMTTSQEEEEPCYRQLLGSHFDGGLSFKGLLVAWLPGWISWHFGQALWNHQRTNSMTGLVMRRKKRLLHELLVIIFY